MEYSFSYNFSSYEDVYAESPISKNVAWTT